MRMPSGSGFTLAGPDCRIESWFGFVPIFDSGGCRTVLRPGSQISALILRSGTHNGFPLGLVNGLVPAATVADFIVIRRTEDGIFAIDDLCRALRTNFAKFFIVRRRLALFLDIIEHFTHNLQFPDTLTNRLVSPLK